ncbi:hypothetical protein F5890DRAFT_1491408 [Lentinula detonsa]|uniref:PHD-type domain-containing protein n=1 Tax=Lentinula detonsa TaxID=2804962 RepID=A0AA38Q6J9_9AGAR|nr:hypothetical protein F5890DRAFT_1491408 [Lentinula detonsa]
MAQVMGPPLSPRETRRSGRRSIPSLSNSHSPESDISPRLKETAQRPPLLSTVSGSNGRNKRLKQEDADDLAEDRKNGAAHSVSTSSNSSTQGSSKTRRKPKEKEKPPPPEESSDTLQPTSQPTETAAAEEQEADEEEEEGGITRCVCGSTEDDPDAGEFMVQCETCKVWQHGLCMGFESEDLLHDGDYYCELCRPDMHTDILKKLSRRPRHSSANSHHTAGGNTRLSRSRSPHQTTKPQPSKRRNTMNSAFDENLKQILETTAIEAGADPATIHSNDQPTTSEFEEPLETNNRNKKRKRAENETNTTKKPRSMSTTSEHPPTVNGNDEASALPPPPPPAPLASKAGGRNKRGGRKSAVVHDVPVDNGDAAAAQPAQIKRSGNSHRKGAKGNPRPPQSNAGTSHASSHDPRRAQGNSSHTNAQTAADSRAYRNSHAYVVSQQPLFTSWNLPDYLSHLEEMLPTDVPKPLEVVAGATGRESMERTTERGVKVKWPSKRTSVADMNKRVRALVEWVGREQASASDRTRRRDALEKALKENAVNALGGNGAPGTGILDRSILAASSLNPNGITNRSSVPGTTSTMRDMEALMEELIGFQEKFGPGARRERRTAL